MLGETFLAFLLLMAICLGAVLIFIVLPILFFFGASSFLSDVHKGGSRSKRIGNFIESIGKDHPSPILSRMSDRTKRIIAWSILVLCLAVFSIPAYGYGGMMIARFYLVRSEQRASC